MKETTAVGVILVLGVGLSLITRNYLGVAFAALGIPAYLAYIAREQNVLARSRLYDRDLFLMIGVAVGVILLFNYFFDPRAGLIILALVVPLVALMADRLKTGEKAQKA